MTRLEDNDEGAEGTAKRGHLRLAYARGQSMKPSGLTGPFPLTFQGIEEAVRDGSPGVYALGSKDLKGRFAIMSIGRSDSDVKARLRECIGAGTFFKFDYFQSEREAFERECELFHDIQPPGNFVHPGRPKGTTLRCPRCRIFGQQP
ncbi:MAG: hypothetical protein NW223_05645 [Hyphomicrobiaceae bacterium]|nr:hypothetical protein [Hyphomicrobiaceae bacterium]